MAVLFMLHCARYNGAKHTALMSPQHRDGRLVLHGYTIAMNTRMGNRNDVVVLGNRNPTMATVISTLALAGITHISGTVRLEDTVEDACTAWNGIANKYLVDTTTLVLANGSFWVHAGLVVPMMEWIAGRLRTLIVSVPAEVDPDHTASVIYMTADRFNCLRRVQIFQAPQHVSTPVLRANSAGEGLRLNGWQRIPSHGHA